MKFLIHALFCALAVTVVAGQLPVRLRFYNKPYYQGDIYTPAFALEPAQCYPAPKRFTAKSVEVFYLPQWHYVELFESIYCSGKNVILSGDVHDLSNVIKPRAYRVLAYTKSETPSQ